MRYLGYIFQRVSAKDKSSAEKQPEGQDFLIKGNFKHLRHIVEREVVVRSAKHVFNRLLKEQSTQSTSHLSHTVAHLLNCLFASPQQIQQLNLGAVKFSQEFLQT